jgi:hypothetical protein
MTAVTADEARDIIRTHWLVVGGDFQHMHGLWAGTDDDTVTAIVDDGQASARLACGRLGNCWVPGVGDRMGADRCPSCCDALGLPHGVGSPKNDLTCRALLGLPASGGAA